MVWPPETTSDLVVNFLETYAAFEHAGPFVDTLLILGFKEELTDRMGISEAKFIELTFPVFNKLFIAEAMVTAPGARTDEWLTETKSKLFKSLGGPEATQEDQKQLSLFADLCLQGAKSQMDDLVAHPKPPDEMTGRRSAREWLRKALRDDIEKARQAGVSDASKVEFYSPPAVIQRVVTGLHPKSKFVKLRTVCTAIQGEHMEAK
jgi:hypothetical protein